MKRTARWCVITIIVVLILFFATLRVFALSPDRPTPLPPHSEIPYSDGELNMIANVVNGEVGGITGTATITYSDGTKVDVDACLLHKIHARVLDNQVKSEIFPDSLRTCMPLRCINCPFETYYHAENRCLANRGKKIEFAIGRDRGTNCPLVPLPEGHGRLGDLDKLEDAFIRYYLSQERSNHLVFTPVEIKQHFADMIGDWPTIVPAEGGGVDG